MQVQGEIMKTKPIGGANAWRWFCSCVAAVLGRGKKEQRSGAGRWSKKWSLTPFLSPFLSQDVPKRIWEEAENLEFQFVTLMDGNDKSAGNKKTAHRLR